MRKSNAKCLICQKPVEQKPKGGTRLYCNDECQKAAHKPDSRMANNKKCEYCGKEFRRSGKSRRICCTNECEIASLQRIAKIEKAQEIPCVFREWILEQYDKGYRPQPMSLALGISRLTIKSWLDRSGRTANQTTHKPRKKRTYYSYDHARSAEAWLSALRQETDFFYSDEERTIEDGRPIFLVGGVTNVKCGADTFCMLISGRLKMNPFDGAVFVFCGVKREKICYIYWDSDGFNVVSRRCETGRYPWPRAELGSVMLINSHDFELVLRRSKLTEKKFERIQWDKLTL